jgi:acyl-CoA dehydrogenase
MDFAFPEQLRVVREEVRALCARFATEYWRDLEPDQYPTEFVATLTRAGYLAALIPEEFGGAGLPLSAATVILEEINASGGNAAACHAQMYTMGTLLRHGTEEQKRRYLPGIANGTLRLQAFGVTEPTAGSDTPKIQTSARREGDHYIINGQKVFISRAQHSDLMLLLARTTPIAEVKRRSDGLSVFLVDLKSAAGQLTIRPIKTMMNHSTTEIWLEDVRVSVANLIGEEGRGFSYILDGMNAERILIAAECIGDGRWFIEKASKYATDRIVFDKPIGANQGIQFPISEAYAAVEAADLMRWKAAWLYDSGLTCGAEANMAKLLAADASWKAANVCLDTHGGWGFTADYDIERKFRETRLYKVAPISNNMILAFIGQNVLGMPRSY